MFGIGGKLKDFLGSAANKIADKVVPKELAPFLPMLAPMFMGPGAGIMSRYLMPQLLTALSSGKTAGDISGTGQVLTGLGSFLSDPGRMALSEQTKPVAGTAGNNQNPFIQDQKKLLNIEGVDTFSPSPYGGPNPYEGMNTTQYSGGSIPGTRMPNPDYIAPTAGMPSQPIYDISQIDNPTFMDYLKTGVNESQDFMQGLNTANTYPGGPEVVDAAGNAVLVKDAGFMQNLPRRAVMQGLQQIGPASTAIDKFKADQDAEATRLSEEQEAYNNAIAELGRYYGSLADPNERFGSYYNNGGLTSLKPKRVGLNQGGMGDIDMMLLELFGNAMDNPKGPAGDQFAPTESNLVDMLKAGFKVVKKGGYDPIDYNQGGRVGLNEGGSAENATNQFQMKLAELLEVGVPLEEAEKQAMDFMQRAFKGLGGGYADGGRIGLNMGGIMNAGSIPQTPAKPKRGLVNEPGGYAGKVSNKLLEKLLKEIEDDFHNMGPSLLDGYDPYDQFEPVDFSPMPGFKVVRKLKADGGTINAGSIPQTPVVPEGMQLDGRGGGFIPMGAQEKQDDVPAMLAKNEFVMTSDAVRAAGGGSIQKGAQRMYDMMNQLEAQV